MSEERLCNACKRRRSREAFSKTQWDKEKRRCVVCINPDIKSRVGATTRQVEHAALQKEPTRLISTAVPTSRNISYHDPAVLARMDKVGLTQEESAFVREVVTELVKKSYLVRSKSKWRAPSYAAQDPTMGGVPPHLCVVTMG
ncbi:hypothetical protein CYMTET_46205, partial [Cymbomonas tetramitiformis]